MFEASTRKPRKSRVVFSVCSRGRYTRNPSLDIYLLAVVHKLKDWDARFLRLNFRRNWIWTKTTFFALVHLPCPVLYLISQGVIGKTLKSVRTLRVARAYSTRSSSHHNRDSDFARRKRAEEIQRWDCSPMPTNQPTIPRRCDALRGTYHTCCFW